ncbi:MAG: hypothetical protein OWT28_09950 [Firmicutes bacterium]|nr:hypothetical protein [Bacillota bacterium]
MADPSSTSGNAQTVRAAEEMLRQTARLADDPFVALTQSCKRKPGEQKLPVAWQDDEES